MGLMASLLSLAVVLPYIAAGLFVRRRRTIPPCLYLLIAAALLFAGPPLRNSTAARLRAGSQSSR
jgi:hypothetical protein